jgi:hypothetical protein
MTMNALRKMVVFLFILFSLSAHGDVCFDINEKLDAYLLDTKVTFVVFDFKYDNNPFISRKLEIFATDAAENIQKYEEDNVEPPLGVFLLADGIPRIYSTWATGSAYDVKVFGISGQKIEKIFEHGSRTVPQAELDEKGHEIITVSEVIWKNGSRKLLYHKYMWDEKNFVIINK